MEAKLFAQLMELLDSVSGGRYPPLSDVVRDVDTNTTVKAKKRSIRAYARAGIAAVVIRELSEREELRLCRLIFSRIGS